MSKEGVNLQKVLLLFLDNVAFVIQKESRRRTYILRDDEIPFE